MADQATNLFDTIQQAPNLRSGLVDTLVAQIESGDLAPGQRLPTEQEIVAATGVSRTVVREALASLRARGRSRPPAWASTSMARRAKCCARRWARPACWPVK